MDSQRKRTVILGTRANLHSVSNFFLNHYRDVVDRDILFKKAHDNGGGNIIGKIGYDLDRASMVILDSQLRDVNFQNIVMNNGHIMTVIQGIFKDRN